MKENNLTQLIVLGILGIVVIVAAIAGFYIISNDNSNTTQTADSGTNLPSNTNDNDQTQNFENPGTFVDYDSSLISEDKTNILFFAADWCPTCQALKRELNNSLNNIPTNVQILEVPYDSVSGATQEHLDLKSKYGITYQHTLVVVDGDLNEVTQWYGSSDLNDILSKI